MKKTWYKPEVEDLSVEFTMGGGLNSPSESNVMTGMVAKYKKAQGTVKNLIDISFERLQATTWYRNNEAEIIANGDDVYLQSIWGNIAVYS